MDAFGLRYVYVALHQSEQFFPTTVDFVGAHIDFRGIMWGVTKHLNSSHVLAPKIYSSVKKEILITYKNESNCMNDARSVPLNVCFEKHLRDYMNCSFPWRFGGRPQEVWTIDSRKDTLQLYHETASHSHTEP